MGCPFKLTSTTEIPTLAEVSLLVLSLPRTILIDSPLQGSTIVQPYDDPSLDPVELGGSVFVSVNKNLWRAVDEYGLERFKFESDDDVVGIWDGHKFVVSVRASIHQ